MLVNGEGKEFSSPNTEASIDRNTGIRARWIPQPVEVSLRAQRKNIDTAVGWYNYRTLPFNNGGTYTSPFNLAVYTVDDRQTLTEMNRFNQFNVTRRWT